MNLVVCSKCDNHWHDDTYKVDGRLCTECKVKNSAEQFTKDLYEYVTSIWNNVKDVVINAQYQFVANHMGLDVEDIEELFTYEQVVKISNRYIELYEEDECDCCGK